MTFDGREGPKLILHCPSLENYMLMLHVIVAADVLKAPSKHSQSTSGHILGYSRCARLRYFISNGMDDVKDVKTSRKLSSRMALRLSVIGSVHFPAHLYLNRKRPGSKLQIHPGANLGSRLHLGCNVQNFTHRQSI